MREANVAAVPERAGMRISCHDARERAPLQRSPRQVRIVDPRSRIQHEPHTRLRQPKQESRGAGGADAVMEPRASRAGTLGMAQRPSGLPWNRVIRAGAAMAVLFA